MEDKSPYKNADVHVINMKTVKTRKEKGRHITQIEVHVVESHWL